MAECSSVDSILEAAALIKTNGGKIDKIVNGTALETVQLGTGSPTPTLRNAVRQIMADASWAKEHIADAPEGDVSLNSATAWGAQTSRTLAERFGDVINVRDFGAAGDGVTDDSAALQAALDRAHALGGGIVFLPPGTYRKAARKSDNSGYLPPLAMYSNTTLVGAGDSSVVYFDSNESLHSYLLQLEENGRNFCFRDFKAAGNLETYTNDIEAKANFLGKYVKHVVADNVTFENLRYFAFTMNQSDDVAVTNCRFLNIYRDGVHCEDATNVRVENNYFYRVADDSVSISQTHNGGTGAEWTDGNIRFASSVIVTGNMFEMSQGVQMSGVKGVIITNNVFLKTLRNPINIHYREMGNIYYTGMFSFIVSNNVILDTISNRTGSTTIVSGIRFTTNNVPFGDEGNTASPNEKWYAFDTSVSHPLCGIKISDNVIGWTLPLGVNFSTYGRGVLLDRDGSYEDGDTMVHGFSDPVMNAGAFTCEGIHIVGPVHVLDIKDNIIFGFPDSHGNYPAIHLELGGENVDKKIFSNCTIEGNKVHDWPARRALSISNASNVPVKCDITIRNNSFNLDPYGKSSLHDASTNKWSSDDACVAVYCSAGTDSGKYGEAYGNVFRNCSQTASTASLFVHDNAVFFEPAAGTTGLDGQEDNRGIRSVLTSHGDRRFIIDGDPSSSDFSRITDVPVAKKGSMPTTGTFVRGEFVAATSFTTATINGSTCRLLGWRRITTGSSHVLGTDWSAEYAIVYNG